MLNFLMTFIYYRLAQVIFFIRFSINQFMIPLTFILLLVAAYYFEERKLLSFNQLAVLQFIFITVLYFGAKAKQKIRQIKAI